MGYFKEKYEEMKAKKDEKKALQAEADAALQEFYDTVYFHHYKMKMDKHNQTREQKEFEEIDNAIANARATMEEIRKKREAIKSSTDPDPESLGGFFTTGEKFGKNAEPAGNSRYNEGDSRYKAPKKEPSVTDERADQVIDETEIYRRARQAMLDGQRRQVKYGIEKYPEPLNANTWTILETIRHIKEETVDTLHYLTMLEIKFEELAKSEVISAGRRMKEEAEEQSKQFYFADKPYDMNYDHVIECPAKECCGNPKGCEAAGTKIEPPKTPNQVRKAYGLDFAYDGLPIKTEDIMLKKDGIELENSDELVARPIDWDNITDEGAMFLPGDEKKLVEAGVLRETPIEVKEVKKRTLAEFTEKRGLPYCTNGYVWSVPEHITLKSEMAPPGELGIVRVASEGLEDIPVIVRYDKAGVAKEDVRILEMAIEEQRARAAMRRNQ